MGVIREALPRAVAERYSEGLLAAFHASTDEPCEPISQPLTSAQGTLVKVMKEKGAKKAETLGIAPELVCRKRDLEDCVRHYLRHQELPSLFTSWRKSIVGDEYLSLMERA